MKKLIIITLCLALSVSLTSIPAQAGSKERRLVKGMVIGAGSAILGATLINKFYDDNRAHRKIHECKRHERQRQLRHHPKKHHRHIAKKRCRENRRSQKVWVAPIYERRWNPGHYNRRGRWVAGHHIKIKIRDGYWERREVWVNF